MLGQMMDQELLISSIIDHAARYHGDTEVVSVNTDGSQTRTNYLNVQKRAKSIASALTKRGMERSDRIATIAWNNHRHFELYYGISFIPLVDGVRSHLPHIKHWVLMEARTDEMAAQHDWMEFYEDLVEEGDENYQWPYDLKERDASSLCYTSGTTGNPKGVLYSHRSTLLHAMMSATPDVMNFSARDCLLPVVPMFHVNAWGSPYAAALAGAKMVMPGPGLDGKSLATLFNEEKVTIAAGVPTIWAGLIQHLEATDTKLPHMKRTVIGGSACPPIMIDKFRDNYDVEVLHAWGMTEMSPLGSVNNLKWSLQSLMKTSINCQMMALHKATYIAVAHGF